MKDGGENTRESKGEEGREDGLSCSFVVRSCGVLFLMMWHLCGFFNYLDNYITLLWGTHYRKHRHNE